MTALNVLVVGNNEAKSISKLIESKYLNKLYTDFESQYSAQIQFNTFKELAKKCKALKIDIVIVENQTMICQGIADVLRANYVNCFGLNAFWSQLILSNEFALNLLNKYDIKTPEKLSFPSEFPLVVKANGQQHIANSLNEVVKISEKIYNYSPEIAKSIFLEKYVEGKTFILTSVFDGKNLYTFASDNLPQKYINNFNDKFKSMLLQESYSFIGYINSRVILSNDNLILLGFNIDFPQFNQDVLYILSLAIYQKLDELVNQINV